LLHLLQYNIWKTLKSLKTSNATTHAAIQLQIWALWLLSCIYCSHKCAS